MNTAASSADTPCPLPVLENTSFHQEYVQCCWGWELALAPVRGQASPHLLGRSGDGGRSGFDRKHFEQHPP